ncbi:MULTISPECIES: CRISPR-associated ring nuclease Crn1 [Metallosphaera]|uniref:CRISPR system ring nuclease SSO2081-like domain-containing protein n=2 Tax=Metallosphaera TaxID=41980 RepID=F4G341_METCR|nr:CRISPR-associated ring nuclease Crn1 [Metallosphaera cuprina]AEB95239.1 conserved hypothetical protein [Metallosphaera cuprina Ar-4]
MVKLISTLGTTPGGVIETYLNLIRGNYEAEDPHPVKIDHIYVIRTDDEAVNFAWSLIKAISPCCESVKVELVDIPLNIKDIYSREDFVTFKQKISSVINDGDYVDITGGRKAMSAAAAISAMTKGKAHVVTSIIPQSEYSRISNLISKFRGMERELSEAGRGNCEPAAKSNLNFCELLSKDCRTVVLT